MKSNSDYFLVGGAHWLGDSLQDPRLSFSEGWATFFGQSTLGNADYVNGASTFVFFDKTWQYNIESPDASCGTPSVGNEVYNSAAMWDVVDGDNPDEVWDKVQRPFVESLFSMVDTMRNDTPDDSQGWESSTATIKDYYNQYFSEYITPNSDSAFNFWTVFNENGMQFDSQLPVLTITAIDPPGDDEKTARISGTVTDNVRVKKIELYINGKKIRTQDNPGDNYSFTLNEGEYRQGKNLIQVRAYDYAGNTYTGTELRDGSYNVPHPIGRTTLSCTAL